jgi:WhiB family redox-sensing transcriptional regulator
VKLQNDLHWPSTPAPGAWRQEAACRGGDLDLFFPPPGEWSSAAKAICRDCPVIAECRAYVDSWPSLRGVWAGEDERTRQNRRWRR